MRPRLHDMFGPDAQQQLVGAREALVAGGARRRQREGQAVGEPHVELAADVLEPARHEIHRRRADEAGDKGRSRLAIDLLGRPHLLDAATVHDDDALGQGHGLDLVVGDIDGRGADLLVHLLDLDPHLHPQLGVEIGQRLVEQEHLRVAYDGAAHRNALALAAGELLGLAVDQVGDVEHPGSFRDPALDLGLGVVLQPQAERHVLGHRHVRIERVVLEHHRDVAVLRRHVIDDVAADHDVAVGDVLEACDHPQGRRLAAAARPDQHHELMVGDVEIDAAHRLDLVVALHHLTQTDVSHTFNPLSRRR